MKLREHRLKQLTEAALPLRFCGPFMRIYDTAGRLAGHCDSWAVQYMRPEWVKLYMVRGFVASVIALMPVHQLAACVTSEMDKCGAPCSHSVEVFCGVSQKLPEQRIERNQVSAIRRELRERLAPGRHTKQQWREIMRRDGWKCLRCGTMKALSKDHIVPLASGGTHHPDNLQTLCRKCNSWKGNRTIDFRTHTASLAAGL